MSHTAPLAKAAATRMVSTGAPHRNAQMAHVSPPHATTEALSDLSTAAQDSQSVRDLSALQRRADDASPDLPVATHTTPATTTVQRKPKKWQIDLEAALGATEVKRLTDKAGASVISVLAKKLDPGDIASVVDFFSQADLTRSVTKLVGSYQAHSGTIGVDRLNGLIRAGLDGGWGALSLPGLLTAIADAGFDAHAPALIATASGGGWSAQETAALVTTGHAAGASLDVVAGKAVARGWAAADLTAAIAASNAQGVANWAAMGVAIDEAEVSAAELADSFAIQGRFTAGNARVKGRADPAAESGACAAQDIPPVPVHVFFADGDLNHYKSGHSYGDFALTRGNIRRAPQSTFFPVGTNIAAQANAALAAAASDGAFVGLQAAGAVAHDDTYNGNICMFFVAGPNQLRMDQCYPAVGEPQTKGTLLAVKAYVDP